MSPELTIALLAGVVLGASAHRAGLCTVKAVAEIMTSAKAHFIWSFIKASLWTTAILGWAAVFGLDIDLAHRPVQAQAILGGAIFGIGAGLNGACSFSTLARLTEGHLAMFFTLAGWGVSIPGTLALLPMPELSGSTAAIPALLLLPLTLWMLWEGRSMWKRRRAIHDGFKNGYWALSVSVFLIALANASLLASGHPWSFTSTALCSAEKLPLSPCQELGLIGAISGTAMLTMLASAIWRKTFRVRRPKLRSAVRHFSAGLLMGTGAALIPGGNDGLILFGLPAFSPHALPTWGAIVLGIALSIYVMRLTGMRVPKISCEGDVCRSTL